MKLSQQSVAKKYGTVNLVTCNVKVKNIFSNPIYEIPNVL